MVRERPAAVLVMAILNIVFGSLGLICSLCAGVGLALFFGGFTSAPAANAGPLKDMISLEQAIPSYKYMMIATDLGRIVLAVILLVAGIGLIGMNPWARWASVFCAVVTIVWSLGNLVYQVGYVNPALVEWKRGLERRSAEQPEGMPPQPMPQQFDLAQNNIQAIGHAITQTVYAVALLIVMFLPHVRTAFAGQRSDPSGLNSA